MKEHKVKLKVYDPDDFWSHVDCVDNDDGFCDITIKEGDMPIRPPTYTYTIEEEEDDQPR